MSTIRTNTLSNVAGTQSTAIENAINGSAKAWVNFNGSVSIRASYNVSSITDHASGDFSLNFTTAMPDTNYSISGFVRSDLSTPNSTHVLTAGNGATKSTTQLRLVTRYTNSGNDGQFYHPETCVQIFR